MKHELFLEFPTAKDYIPIARMATAFAASLKDLDLDFIEDLRLIITEACNLCYFLQESETISLRIQLKEEGICFEISSIHQEGVKGHDQLEMSQAIIQSLADEVHYKEDHLVILKRISG